MTKEKNHLQKWLEENKEEVLAQMSSTDQNEMLMIAIRNAINLEKSKYSDWDDKKHYIKVELRPLNNALEVYAVKKDKEVKK